MTTASIFFTLGGCVVCARKTTHTLTQTHTYNVTTRLFKSNTCYYYYCANVYTITACNRWIIKKLYANICRRICVQQIQANLAFCWDIASLWSENRTLMVDWIENKSSRGGAGFKLVWHIVYNWRPHGS